MITEKQIIALACATLDQGLDFSRSRITRATDAELVKFAQEAIDAATVDLKFEIAMLQLEVDLLTKKLAQPK